MTVTRTALQIEFQFLDYHAHANVGVVVVGVLVLLTLALTVGAIVGASMDTAAQRRAARHVADQRRQLADDIERLRADRRAARISDQRAERSAGDHRG